MGNPTDAQWLAALVASESHRPEDWQYLAWVVRNRVEGERFPDTYVRVIRQPMQFSYWNKWGNYTDYEAYREGTAGRIAGQLDEAHEIADWVLHTPRAYAPFDPGVDHFWSPVSMPPDKRIPTWAVRMHRQTPEGVDPWRFIFASSEQA